MFEINEQSLKDKCGSVIYERGLDMYLRNKVRRMDIEIEKDNESSLDVLSIEAIVESAYENSNYEVYIEMVDKINRIGYSCSCPHSLKRGEVCKHVVAVLLKWNREKERIMRKNPRLSSLKSNQFIESMKEAILSKSKNHKELKLEIKYEFESLERKKSSVELKIGEEKTYVVKNMREFLKYINSTTGEELEFGKGFTYNPYIHKFSDVDKKIIDLLTEIYEIDMNISYQNNLSSHYLHSSGLISGKKIYMSNMQVKRFFETIKGKSFDAVINGKSLTNLIILEEDMPLEFSLKLKDDFLVIGYGKEIPVPLTDGGEYFYFKGNIYHPSEEQIRLYNPFYKEYMRAKSGKLIFSRDNIENAASYVIPSIKRISSNVVIDEKIKDKFSEEALKIMTYLDKAEEGISAEVVFQYGDDNSSLFSKEDKKNDKILIRNVQKELEFSRLLNSLGFKGENNKYILTDEEAVMEFMVNGVLKLQEASEVYYSEAFKGIKIYGSTNIKSSIRLNDEDLLEFTFSIDGLDKGELKDILEAVRQKKKYYKLKKGGFVSLESKEIQDVGRMIEYLDIKDSDLEKDKILLSKYNAIYIDENFKNSTIVLEKNKKFRELVNNIKEVKDIDFVLPEHLENIMRGYQKFGFKWLKTLSGCGFGGILADEMGLGKTLQTIAFIESEVIEDKEERKPSLVVAPTSLVYNWKSEIERFAPSLKTLVVSGNKGEREEKRKEIEEADIVITSYPLIRRDIEEYKDIKFRYCILDEAQQIKNPASINAQSVKEIRAQGYFALTGTPIENSLTELWSIFDFLMPGYLLSHGKFSKKYETPIVKNKDKKALEELNKHIKPFILRRLKKEVIKELPPKIEHKLVVEMTEEQKKLYAAFIEEAKYDIHREIKEKGFNRSKIKILSTLTRLRQICCDPSVFIENFNGESGKMEALDYLLEESINEGHRILLFSQFTTVLKNIAERLNKSKIEYMYLDGQTKSEERGKLVKEFNDGRGSVFLISLKAGGTGLNLTGADVVIHFDPWWNPAVEDQATDRAHRIGQEKTVEVIKIIARGTIEEKIYNLQEKKKDIIKSIMSDENSEHNLISQMTQEEIEELFKI